MTTLTRILQKRCDTCGMTFLLHKAEFSDGSRLIISANDAERLAAEHSLPITSVDTWETANA